MPEPFSLQKILPYLTFAVIIVATFFVALIFRKVFSNFIKRSSEDLDNDPTNYQFLRHAISFLIYIIGFSLAIYSIPSLRSLANSLLAGAGILAVVVGFASQQALSNIVSGTFLVLFKPFKVNDRLTIKDTLTGVVEDITLRHTVIRNFENRRILIPNSVMSSEIVVNADFADEKICRWVEFPIALHADVPRAKEIMREAVMQHPNHIDNRNSEQIEAGDPEVTVRLIAIRDFSLLLRAWAWAEDSPRAFEMYCDLLEQIRERFIAEGIEIPYPYQNVILQQSKEAGNNAKDQPE